MKWETSTTGSENWGRSHSGRTPETGRAPERSNIVPATKQAAARELGVHAGCALSEHQVGGFPMVIKARYFGDRTFFRENPRTEDQCDGMPKGAVERTCLLFIASVSCALAEPQSSIDEARLPPQVQRINGVLVPVPDEIFRVLDTFRDSNWKAVLHPDLSALRPAGTPARIALSLGLVLGEGFLAISAEDEAEMQDLGKAAVKLARALGVEKSVIRRKKSVMDHVDRKDWAAVRKEWSEVTADLKAAMIEIKSEPLSQLVSLGGWLRGLEALATLASQHYSAGSAQLLHQPVMLDYFAEVVASMHSKFREDPAVIAMEEGIGRLQSLMGSKHGPSISKHDVRAIHHVSADLVKFLCTE